MDTRRPAHITSNNQAVEDNINRTTKNTFVLNKSCYDILEKYFNKIMLTHQTTAKLSIDEFMQLKDIPENILSNIGITLYKQEYYSKIKFDKKLYYKNINNFTLISSIPSSNEHHYQPTGLTPGSIQLITKMHENANGVASGQSYFSVNDQNFNKLLQLDESIRQELGVTIKYIVEFNNDNFIKNAQKYNFPLKEQPLKQLNTITCLALHNVFNRMTENQATISLYAKEAKLIAKINYHIQNALGIKFKTETIISFDKKIYLAQIKNYLPNNITLDARTNLLKDSSDNKEIKNDRLYQYIIALVRYLPRNYWVKLTKEQWTTLTLIKGFYQEQFGIKLKTENDIYGVYISNAHYMRSCSTFPLRSTNILSAKKYLAYIKDNNNLSFTSNLNRRFAIKTASIRPNNDDAIDVNNNNLTMIAPKQTTHKRQHSVISNPQVGSAPYFPADEPLFTAPVFYPSEGPQSTLQPQTSNHSIDVNNNSLTTTEPMLTNYNEQQFASSDIPLDSKPFFPDVESLCPAPILFSAEKQPSNLPSSSALLAYQASGQFLSPQTDSTDYSIMRKKQKNTTSVEYFIEPVAQTTSADLLTTFGFFGNNSSTSNINTTEHYPGDEATFTEAELNAFFI